MSATIVVRPQAQREIDEHADYIAVRNPGAAERFLESLAETIATLLRFPAHGRELSVHSERLQGLRRVAMRGFRNYLVFYLPTHTGIEILHVWHGAQDIDSLLRAEDASDAD